MRCAVFYFLPACIHCVIITKLTKRTVIIVLYMYAYTGTYNKYFSLCLTPILVINK